MPFQTAPSWQQSLESVLSSEPYAFSTELIHCYLQLTAWLIEKNPSLQPPTLSPDHGDTATTQWIAYYQSMLDRNASSRSLTTTSAQSTTPAGTAEVGSKEAFEKLDFGHGLMRQSILEPEDSEHLQSLFQAMHWLRPNTQKIQGPVILITPGAHGIRLPSRLSIVQDWLQYNDPKSIQAWYVVTGDRVMNAAEHQALKQSYHPDLSDKDIQTYAKNENDYWPWRIQHMLTHDVDYKNLKRIPQPQFLTPKIFPWVHQQRPPRATTKDNAVALAQALKDPKTPLTPDTTIVIALEAPFDLRMPMIFERILRMHGITNPVISSHGSQDLTPHPHNNRALKALGLSANHASGLALNQMYMHLVECYNLHNLAKHLKHKPAPQGLFDFSGSDGQQWQPS